jgi:agmatinase
MVDLPRATDNGHLGPVNSALVPRYGGAPTFALLPRIDEAVAAGHRPGITVVGVPFDAGVSYRPGARFGPSHIRQSSRLLRPYNPATDTSPFAQVQVVDAGDLVVNPFDLDEAIASIQAGALELTADGASLVALGGDHTIALPLLRAAVERAGEPLALLHFDAHLDTWDTYFGAAYTHGTPFRRAAEEGLLDSGALCHVGTRGPLYGRKDLDDDSRFGFGIVTSADVYRQGVDAVAGRLADRIGNRPVYVSVDIDVLDPAHAPGTGTPEAGGLTSRELLEILRGLRRLRASGGPGIVGADVVEVSPAYDHAELTGIAAAHVAYDLIGLMGERRSTRQGSGAGDGPAGRP